MIDSKLIQDLRAITGAGIVDCKRALEEANGDLAKAQDVLRKKGQLKAAKKQAEREAKEGVIAAYIHANKKVGVLVELNCETDFVARNEEFQQLAYEIAMHIAASDPRYVKPEEVPAEVLAHEREMALSGLKIGKPEMTEKIVEGKLKKFYEEMCLLNQPYIRDENMTVADLISAKVAKTGEKISVKRFVRYQI